jgi:hypothetical protein
MTEMPKMIIKMIKMIEIFEKTLIFGNGDINWSSQDRRHRDERRKTQVVNELM